MAATLVCPSCGERSPHQQRCLVCGSFLRELTEAEKKARKLAQRKASEERIAARRLTEPRVSAAGVAIHLRRWLLTNAADSLPAKACKLATGVSSGRMKDLTAGELDCLLSAMGRPDILETEFGWFLDEVYAA